MCKESHSNLNKYAIEKNATKRLSQKESRNDRNARRQNFCQGKFKHFIKARKCTRNATNHRALHSLTKPLTKIFKSLMIYPK